MGGIFHDAGLASASLYLKNLKYLCYHIGLAEQYTYKRKVERGKRLQIFNLNHH
jgi:hypothetical protein